MKKDPSIHPPTQPRQSFSMLVGLMVALLLPAGLMPAASMAQPSAPAHVLLLNAYHPGYRWSDQVVAGIRDTLESATPRPHLYVEYLDSKRFYSPSAFNRLADLVRDKYRHTSFDVLIAADNNSLQFLKQHRHTLFAGIPAVVCGANDLKPADIGGMAPITGINEAADVRETIDLALRLTPAAQRIVVVNDTTPTGRQVRGEIQRIAAAYSPGLAFEYWDHLGRDDLLRQLAGLKRHDIVLYTFFFRDAAGRFYEYDDSARRICAASPVPVFGLWEFNLGHGILGGKLVSGFAQGKAAGKMALQIMNGVDAATIPLQSSSPNRFAFDYHVMDKYGIEQADLPEESLIINRRISFYQQYKQVVWSGIIAFGSLALLILFLLLTIGRRRKMEQQLRDSRQSLKSITDNIPGVVYRFHATPDHQYGLDYVSDKAVDIFGLPTDPETWLKAFSTSIHDADRERFGASIADAVAGIKPWHFTGRFVKPSGEFIWFSGNAIPHEDNGSIIFDGVLMDITESKLTEQKLRKSEQRMTQIINFLPDPTFVIDQDSRVIAWNRAMVDLSGIAAEAMLGKGNYEYAIPFYGERRPVMIDLVSRWDDGVAERYHNVRKKGDLLFSETRNPNRLIGNRHFNNTAGPLYDETGAIVGAIETIHDITERRAVETTLTEREALLRQFVEYTPAAVAMCDTQMNYLAYSRRWVTDYHLPDEDLTGRCHYDVFEVIPDHWKEQHQRCFSGEVVENEEEPFTRADGSTDWVRRSLHPWRTTDGDVGGLILFTEVVTHKRQVEENLRLMESVLKNSPAVLFRWDAADGWPVSYVSENVSQYGYTPDDLVQQRKSFAEIIHPADLDAVLQHSASAERRGLTHYQQEYRIRTKSGDYRWVDDRTMVERDAQGVITHHQGVVIDITDRKTAQEEVRKRQVFLESVLYHAPDAIITLDARHRVTDWNPASQKIFGYASPEALGRELDALILRGRSPSGVRDFSSGDRVEAFETVRYRKDDTPVHVIAAGSPIMVDGELQAVVAMYTDVTALKQAEEELRRSERMLRRIIDMVPSMIFVKNAQGRFLMANQAVADSYGLTVEQLVGRHQSDVHPDENQAQAYLAADREAIQSGVPVFVHEEPYLDRQGVTRWLEVTKLPCELQDFGEPAIVGLATDITERRAVEARIQESEKRYRIMFENTGTGTVLSEADTTLSMVNSEFAQMVGYTREEIEGKMSWTQFIVPEDIERMRGYHEARRRDPSSAPTQWECGLVDRQGNVRRMLLKVRLIPGTKTSIGAFLDISDLKQAEEAMVEAHRMLRLVLDTIPVRVFWKDRKCRYLGCNQPFAQDAGRSSPDELIGKDDFAFSWGRDQAELYRRDDLAVMDTGQARINYEEPQTTPDHRTIWLQTSKVPMRDGEDNIIGVLGTYQDITERRHAEEELNKLRNYLSNIINSMPSVLVGVDTEGRVTQWNKQAEQMTGMPFESVRSQPLSSVFPHLIDEMERVKTAIRDRQVVRDPKIYRQKNGETRFEDVTIFPLVTNGVEGAVIRVDDVTDRVRMEEMMIQSEKMLSVGGLAAGMAHEINNPLAGILQNTAVLENRLFGDLPANRSAAEAAGTTLSTIRKYLELRKLPTMIDNIRMSGNRAASIVKNMLSFARKSDRIISSHDLGTLLDQAIELAQTDYDMKKRYDFKQIGIVREYDPSVAAVPCEGSKLQQVFLNILKNGAEAMAGITNEQVPPQLILRVKNEGVWVRVEIEDNGPGMDENTRRRIFEPFFTTKPVGEGTGLGLSVSYFIVTENHGGKMHVQATDGGGTRFVIRLPKSGKP